MTPFEEIALQKKARIGVYFREGIPWNKISKEEWELYILFWHWYTNPTSTELEDWCDDALEKGLPFAVLRTSEWY